MPPNLGGADHLVYTIESQSIPQVPIKSKSEKKSQEPKINVVNLILLGFAQFLGGLTYSLLSSFYTDEATKKGLSFTQCGLVSANCFLNATKDILYNWFLYIMILITGLWLLVRHHYHFLAITQQVHH